ncbi:MAG: hypothetical protein E7289_10325 [Lachnospiraceae bacterium]|nr:hypothetical protein [Lachnospiraceae bacterium]
MLEKKKAIAMVLVACNLLFILTGCENQIPDMTEQQNALITEYAAGLLLKYHSDYKGRLVDTSIAPEEKTPIVTEPIEEESVSDNSMTGDEQGEVSESDAAVSNNSTGEADKPTLTMAQVLGADGFDVRYRSYEVCDTYPNVEVSPEDLFFSMKAGTGNKLLVLKIDITNVGAQEALFNTLEKTDLDCKVIINGGNKQSAYISMLENDFMAMNHMVAAGETMEAAVITEMPESEAQQITDVKLLLEYEERSSTVSAMQ